MSENENSKSKGKRLEEKETQEAELERSLVVVKVKEAHKQIEETEKSRKRPTVLSICHRIDQFSGIANSTLGVLMKQYKKKPIPIGDTVMTTIEDFERTYASISYDFRKNLDVRDESMEKMFPAIRVRKDVLQHAIDDLLSVWFQMQQMKSYCERLL